MKRYTMFVGLLALASTLAWSAEDGAALYKSNCAACHKADASGNPAMKSPALKGKTAADVQKAVSTDPKHAGVKGKVNADQLTAIGNYLSTLK
jgi:mono/diheme cytochrome c family protein